MRRQRLQAASSSALSLPAAAPQQDAPVGDAGQQQEQQRGQEERAVLRLDCSEGGGETRVLASLSVQPGVACGPVSGGLPPLPAALAALAQANGSSSCGNNIDAALLQQAATAVVRLAAAQGVALPALSGTASSLSPAAAGAAGIACAPEEGANSSELQAQCNALQLQVGRLQAELQQVQQDAEFARDAADRKQQVRPP